MPPPLGEVAKWSTADVVDWVTGLGFECAAQLFRKAEVDGEDLIRLQKHELRDEVGIASVKDRKALWEHIAEVQGVLGPTVDRQPGAEVPDEEYDAVDEIVGDSEAYQVHIRRARRSVSEEEQLLQREHGVKVDAVMEHFLALEAELAKRREAVVQQLNLVLEYKKGALQQQQDWLAAHDEALTGAIEDVRLRLRGTRGSLDRDVADLLKQRLCSVERVAVPIRPVEEAFINCFMDKRLEDDVRAVRGLGFVEPHPQRQGEVFEHSHDFDKQGILHFLGRCFGKEAEYRNPGAPFPEGRQLVEVRASSLEYGTPHYAIAHPCADPKAGPTQTFLSQDEPGAWVSLHFGPKHLVCPSRYTIRNSTVVPGHSLANWALEGSKDGHSWDRLCEHSETTALSPQRGSVATFDVAPPCVTFYHRLRIRLTGPNYHVAPHTRYHYLMMSGLEIYGVLKTVM